MSPNILMFIQQIIVIIDRKWNDELDETIKALQEFLENQCDTYFVNIKERTVKVTAQLRLLNFFSC